MTDTDKITRDLTKLAGSLPTGSEFEFHVDETFVNLKILSVPTGRRGCGTSFLAQVLALVDAYGLSTALEADPTDESGDPGAFELVRWYARFGFEIRCLSIDERVCMERAAHPQRDGHQAILDDYEAAREHDIGWDAYREWREAAYLSQTWRRTLPGGMKSGD